MNTANINSLWADLMIEELIRQGIDYFCISPGSRSTPLTAAIASRKESRRLAGDVVVHFDERGAAFHALGYARATGKPAVLVCTSGTAAANYYPAIIEASQDNLPLIALTADRPPELRHTGANQTIDQLNLYGKYVRWSYDLPCPDEKIDPHELLTMIDRAVSRTRLAPFGPVQLNCPFREPLAPLNDGSDLSACVNQLENWYNSGKPLDEDSPTPVTLPDDQISAIAKMVANARCGLILAGRLDNETQRTAVRSLGKKLGWPLLADITSGLRFDSSDHIIHHYDLLLTSEVFEKKVRPSAILHFGGRFVSKRLLEFIERAAPANYILVNESPDCLDPARRVTDKIVCGIVAFCESLRARVSYSTANSCFSRWQAGNGVARKIISSECESASEITEAAVARHISRRLADNTGLFLASSMPVRDLDIFGDVSDNAVAVAANRGASGIDGTIASATGFAAGLDRPVTLLIGDLAFLHDLNSLALLHKISPPVAVVVLNNDGGGIFQHLPVAGLPDVFEKYFITPHGLTFAHAAEMFDLPYCRVNDMESLEEAYELSQQSANSSIIEISLDRGRSLSFYRSVQTEIVKVLENLE